MKINLNLFIASTLITNVFVLSQPIYGMENFSKQKGVQISKKFKDVADHQCIETVIGELEKCKEAAQNRGSKAKVSYDKIELELRNFKTFEEADHQVKLDLFEIIGPDIGNLVIQHTIMLTHNITGLQLDRILKIMINLCLIKKEGFKRALRHMDRIQGIKDGHGFVFSQDDFDPNKNALSSELENLNYHMSLPNWGILDKQRETIEYNKKESLKIIKKIIIENMESYKDIYNKPHPLWGEYTGVLSSDGDTSGSLSDMFPAYKDTYRSSLLNINAPFQRFDKEDNWQSQQAQERWWRDYEDYRDGDY